MMRKFIAGLFAGMCFVAAVKAGEYTLHDCKVVDVGEVVTIEDRNGNLWEVSGDYELGETVNLRMNGKGTDFIEDDVVVRVEE